MDVKSPGRILDMLEVFAASPEAMGLSQVAKRMGIPKSSAQELLATLTGRGYLARVGVEYSLPAELRSAGWIGSARARLLLLASPVLKQLSQETEQSAFLAALVEDEVQYLAKELTPHEIRYDASLALRRPVYCTASGIVLLAQQGPGVAEAVLARVKRTAITPNTITDRDALLRWIKRARRDGFTASHGGYIVGGSGIAAPVFGPTGGVIAALAIGGSTA
ncbi:MAG: IclR family transcriptional regulator, partial [Pseudomonadota bacterium]